MPEVPDAAISWAWIRAGGPGGQHQNKTETAVQLRYSIPLGGLSQEVAEKLRALAGSKLTSSDEIVIEAREYRSREMNRKSALSKLYQLIELAATREKKRRKTKPTRASVQKRIQHKRENSQRKQMRRKPDFDPD